jgi:hypothetical protein
MDLSALGVSLAILAVCGLAAAIAPCLLAARIAPTEVLRAGVSSAGRREQRLWTGLVLAEVALTVGLLVVSGVLLRSWQAQLEQGLGYRTDDVLRIALFVNPEDAREPDELRRIHNRIRETVTVTPGVESLGMLWPTLPLRQPAEVVVRFSGKVPRFQEEGLRAASFAADPQLFQTLGIPVVAGRPFTAADEPGSPPVALVSASVAEQMGGLEAALGNEVEIGGDRLLVVGVVGDIRSRGPRSDDSHRFEIYRPLAQAPRALVSLYITVATDSARGEVATDPLALVEPLSRRLAQIAPWSALDWVGTVESYRHRIYLQEPEFLAGLVTIFSATATTLSAIGLFALLSAAVTRSRPELGIRLALGASPARLAGRVLGRSLLLVTVAVGIGGALGAAGVRLVESSVWGVTTRDPASFAAAALVIIAMGAVAATIPAVRAARIDPASSLKL